MRVFISGASTPISYQTGVNYKRMLDAKGRCTISIADDEFSAYNTYKDSHFDLLTIVDDDWNPDYVRIFDNTGGTFADVHTEATADAGTFNLYGHTGNSEAGDIVYIGRDEAFDYCRFDVATANSDDNAYAIEYWDGDSWEAFDPVEKNDTEDQAGNSQTFEQDGIIVWARPSDWAATTIAAQSAFWVRFRITSADTSNPTGNRVQAGALKFEGRVGDVKFKRNQTTLIGRGLGIELEDFDLINNPPTTTADFEKDSGIITAVDNSPKTITNTDRDWTVNEFAGYAVLVHTQPTVLNSIMGYMSPDGTPILNGLYEILNYSHDVTHKGGTKDRHFAFQGYQLNSAPQLEYLFRGDPADLASITISFRMRISNEAASAKLQIKDLADDDAWDDVADGALTSGNWIEDSTTISSGEQNYFLNETLLLRVLVDDEGTAAESVGNQYLIEVDYLYVTLNLTNRYGPDENTFFEIQSNTATVLTLDIDPTSKHVTVGDQYSIGWRVDTAVEQFFSDYSSSLSIAAEMPTIAKYTVRDFSDMKGSQFVREMAELAGGHWWLGKGRLLRIQNSFTSSGITIDETMVIPGEIEILKPEANFLKTARVTGMPEIGDSATQTSGSESGPRSILKKFFHVRNFTELQSLVDTFIGQMDTESLKPNILLPIKLQSANIRSLDIGLTIDVKLDVDADASDEIDESDIIIYSIEETQEVGETLQTVIQVGFYPIDESERLARAMGRDEVRTNIFSEGRDDIYEERYLNKEGGTPPVVDLSQFRNASVNSLGGMGQITQNLKLKDSHIEVFADFLNNADDAIIIGDQTDPGAIDVVGGIDILWRRDAADKFTGGATAIGIGTTGVNEDMDFWGDADGSAGSGDFILNVIKIASGDITSVSNNDISIRPHGTGDFTVGTVGDPTDLDGTGDGDYAGDVDAVGQFYLGASSFQLLESGNNLVVVATDGINVLSGSASQAIIQFTEDGSNYGIVGYNKTDGIMQYVVNSAGTDYHHFNDDVVIDGDCIPQDNNSGECGASNQYWATVHCGIMHYVTLDEAPWDDLGDLDIIDSMIGDDGIERMPNLIKNESGKFVNPAKKDKLVFGAIRELRKENKELKELIYKLQEERRN